MCVVGEKCLSIITTTTRPTIIGTKAELLIHVIPPPRQLKQQEEEKKRAASCFFEGGIARFLHGVETESLSDAIDGMFEHEKSRADGLVNLTGTWCVCEHGVRSSGVITTTRFFLYPRRRRRETPGVSSLSSSLSSSVGTRDAWY